ncbi:MAG: DHA2 family efflux MFS transporter permease subunit [Proteobacteria bacterium]|nr:DHA2 family efflux MFS transporter permease subunit [Pseudomonadota bacterium]HQR04269.1 DHA2 family efflux MFS transporter permease subunit [Rhodocyclaceae bacterium]
MSAPAAAATHPPLEGSLRVFTAFAISLAILMNVMDALIANVCLSDIAGSLGNSPTQGTWVLTSFTVATAIILPLSGWLAKRLGEVRLFVLSTALFTFASAMCGMSTSIEMLVGFRVLQGFAAGPMLPLGQSLILQCYPREKMTQAVAIFSMVAMVGPVVGPPLGGWLTDTFSWPWIFFINVPLGIFTASACWFLLKDRESHREKVPVDYVGILLTVVWIASLQIMLDKGRELNWFESAEVRMLATTAVVGFCMFLVWELNDAHPAVELRLFKNSAFTIGVITLCLSFAVYYTSLVIQPLWLQQTLGFSATMAGVIVAPYGIVAMALTPIAAKLLPKVGVRAMSCFALATLGLVSLLRAQFTPDLTPWDVIIPQLLVGVPVATLFIPLNAMIMMVLPPDKATAGGGLATLLRMTTGAIGTSIVATLWEHRSTLHHAQLAEHLTLYDANATQTYSALAAAGLEPAQTYAIVDRLVTVQAQTIATNELFWASAMLFFGLIPIIWLAKPGGKVHAGPTTVSMEH